MANSLINEYRWPLIGGLLLILIISASVWLRVPVAPTYASVHPTRFEVLPLGREELDALPESVRGFLLNPDLREVSISGFDEVAQRAEFAPRLPQSDGRGGVLPPPKFSVVEPIRTKVAIRTGQLQAALTRLQIADVSIPGTWEGILLEVDISAGIVADYGRFRLGQRLPMEIRAPDGFPMDEFLKVLLRIGGLDASRASALGSRFQERPAEFLLAPERLRIDSKEVEIAAGAAILLRFHSDDGPERRSLAWNARGRVYFLAGILTEADAVAIANSL